MAQPVPGGGTVDRAEIRALRRGAMRRAIELGAGDLAERVELVVSELVTNALLHGRGCGGVAVEPIDNGVRVAVSDFSRAMPLLGRPSDEAMTGRGLALIKRITSNWATTPTATGKTVAVDITRDQAGTGSPSPDELLAAWGADELTTAPVYSVELGEVPTDLLLAAKAHVDNLVREFELMAPHNEGSPQGHLQSLLAVITDRFATARLSIKQQALTAAHRGAARTNLTLALPADAAAAGREYLRALDELDDYCRANRLFTLETEPEHRIFRQWYVGQIIEQVQLASGGRPARAPVTFERRILDEVRSLDKAKRSADRAARLYRLARALAASATPEAIAEAVLDEGVAALGADAGGVLLARPADARLSLPGAVGYDERVVSFMRDEPVTAELPAASALRTGQAIWLETREERDQAFPEVAILEPAMEALCAVPLEVGGTRLGALRFSFKRPRVFDEEERAFVIALADQTAQALDRAQLQHDRIEVSRRLQRSLLPPALPSIPNVDVAAIYQPFEDGVDAGGDFYDVWPLGDRQWAIAVGDASGTGPEAAGLTARVRYSLRALAVAEHRPHVVLRQLNGLLASSVTDSERFCTAIFAVITIGETSVIELATGGHPQPLLRDHVGKVRAVPLMGTLLGILDDAAIGREEVVLTHGSTLVLFTDGVIEARSARGEQFGVAGVERVLAAVAGDASAVADALHSSVLAHCGRVPQDDMALVVIKPTA